MKTVESGELKLYNPPEKRLVDIEHSICLSCCQQLLPECLDYDNMRDDNGQEDVIIACPFYYPQPNKEKNNVQENS